MNHAKRGSMIIALILITVGVVFLAVNFIPGVNPGNTWPALFFIFAAAFFIPPFIWHQVRRGLAALFIPGAIMLALGLIFTLNIFSQDWASWAYAWLLIPGGVGFGLALAAWYGHWGRVASWVGIWILLGSVVLFALFAMLFGSPLFQSVGPALLIIGGIVVLVRSFRK
jgi:hypothetical protein